MKKIFILLFLAVVLVSTAFAQQWVGFSKNEPSAPEMNLLSSNSQTVSFTVTIPGIYTQDTVVNGTAFTRLILPSGAAVNPAGSPEIPVLSYRVAIPDCSGIDVDYQIISTQPMLSCWVYPVPNIVLDENEKPVEQFTFDADAYTQQRVGDEPAAMVASDGAFRAQRYVEVMVCPVEFCPVTRQLSVIDQIEITLTFTNPQGELRQNTGIFNKVAVATFINYEDDGMSALVNDKAFEKEGFVQGSVQWKKINSPTDVFCITADYLIICADDFYPSGGTPHDQILRLANYRAFYNGFDVMILNVEDILSDAVGFYYEGNPTNPYDPDKYKKEQRMRTCIKTLYEEGNANHTGDGKLGYILLVGDCIWDNTGTMPTSYENKSWDSGMVYAADYYFTCITKDAAGNYTGVGSLCIGRLSVKTDEHLFNMVQKTINHETEFSPQAWRKSAGFTNGIIAEPMLEAYDITVYVPKIKQILSNAQWNYNIVNFYELNDSIKIPTLNYLNEGVVFAQYFGQGYYDKWMSSWLYSYISINDFSNMLNNSYKAPFITGLACGTGSFDMQVECLAEFLTRYDSIKGAVGYIGASGPVQIISTTGWGTRCLPNQVLNCLFRDSNYIAGEMLMLLKTSPIIYHSTYIWDNKYAFNLLGDPALNIFATGYEVTRDVTADACPVEIPCNVRVHNGATLTIPDNCNLNFIADGNLVIEENGNLNIGNGVQITGELSETSPAIYVKGGGFTLGNNVSFTDLSGGIFVAANNLPPWFYDNEKLYDIKNVTFNNTPFTHRGSRLNISNCIFEAGSDLTTYISRSFLDSCTFDQASFLSWHNNYLPSSDFKAHTTIKNSHFNGYSYNNSAIQLYNSAKYSISNNIITGYETGISLTSSGETLLSAGKGLPSETPPYQPSPVLDMIHKNTISNCGRGIELYSSVGHFQSNNIFNNGLGVALYNNSNTSFGSSKGPDTPNQMIQDNDSYELYASTNSFPTIFRYNQIIDEDNLGNTYNDPMIYWDLTTVSVAKLRDITYNCWGDNFDPLEDLYPYEYFDYEPTWQCGKSASTVPDVDETLYQTALTYFDAEDYENAEITFKELIETYPYSPFAIAALHELFALEQFLSNDYAALHNYYATFTPADSALFNVADFLATRCNVVDKNWQPAVDWYENRIENPPSYQDSVFAVIDLGDIHLMMEADTLGTKHAACHYTLVNIKPRSKQEYEENKTALLATLPQIKKTHSSNHPQTSTKGVLSQNIPNPTNGTTTINYEIYTEGAVEIQLYNSMGQLLQILPQGTLVEGQYQTTISLAEVPVGMYYYALFINKEKTDTKKMVVY